LRDTNKEGLPNRILVRAVLKHRGGTIIHITCRRGL
jgi:hypothetical protein